MSVTEQHALDLSVLMMESYELADLIKRSQEMKAYLYWKEQLAASEEAQKGIRELDREKESFREYERFGHFHPSYHEGMERVKAVEQKLHTLEVVQAFMKSEEELDQLLYEVSKLIAHSVSDSIKVPSNQLLPESGCSSGGSCSGNCG
ncbi:YlbF family regulator [Marinicrinis sediminis]|uniref:YlbF family regulator n=1 Tax=Marinicrinis sediminis TaxID=1652465 RepID=A0ABW5R568_9BACL